MQQKILYIANVDFFLVSHRLNLAIEARNKGYEVHIACEFTDKYNFLKKRGFILHELSYKRSSKFPSIFKEIKSFFEILFLLKKISPNLVHVISLKPIIYVGIITKFFPKIKLIISITGLGYVFNNTRKKIFFLKKILIIFFKLIFRNKNVVTIFQNSNNKSILESHGVEFCGKTKLIKGAGVDLDKFKYVKEPTEEFRVIMISRLLVDKGVREFSAASKILYEKNIKVKMIIVGGIDNNPTSIKKEEVFAWEENNNLEWWGYKKNIPKIISMANLICLPSYHEGFPKVLMEAAAGSRAVIRTDVPGCRDAIVPNKTGILIELKNSEQIASAIEDLKNNHTKRKQMGLEARKHAEKYFNIDRITKEHMEIYSGEYL